VFKVARGNSGSLLSFDTSRKLDLYSREDFKISNELTSFGCCAVNGKYAELMAKYSMVFNNGIGKLKGVKIKLNVDKSVRPVRVPYRRQAYGLIDPMNKELDFLLENGIIEPYNGPVEWVSQMVVVPKEKKPGQVRITCDMRLVNKAIIREKFPFQRWMRSCTTCLACVVSQKLT
jgi:hypothetical protein